MNEGQFNFPPLTRNQLLQMGRIVDDSNSVEAQTVVEAADPNSTIPKTTVAQIATSGVVNPYAPKIDAPKMDTSAEAAPKVEPPQLEPLKLEPENQFSQIPVEATTIEPVTEQVEAAAYEPVLGETEEPLTSQIQLFDVSPNLNIEPQTASIIIDNFEPLDAISIAISETGELLKTGSIELPNLSTNTGEIATILDAAQVDEAIAADSVNGYVSTIAPLRASGVVNTAGKIGIMPSRSAKGQGGGFAILTLSLLMITAGGLVLAAFMLGLLK